jgi:hypothetical protein
MGTDGTVRALRDSGSEIDGIDNSLSSRLSIPHEIIGEVALRPLVGPPVSARLVKIPARLVDSGDPSDQVDDYHDVIAAACDGIHEEVILSEPTAQHLSDAYNCRVNLLYQSNNVIMEKYQPDMGNQFTTGEVNVVTRSMQNKRAATSGLSSNNDVIDQSSNLHTDADSDDACLFV